MMPKSRTNYLLFIFLAFAMMANSCGYKTKSQILAPLKSSTKKDRPDTTNNDNGPKVPTNNGDGEPDLPNDSLEDLLDQLYRKFIIVELENGNYDTKVNFEGLYKAINDDENNQVNVLLELIRLKFADPKALKEAGTKTKIAFYINAYNFHTLRYVSMNYFREGQRIKSIRDLSKSGRFRKKQDEIFKRKDLILTNKRVSLWEIENTLLPELTDNNRPEVYFGLNQVASGSPVFQREAYRGDKLDEQLANTAKFSVALRRIFHNDNLRALTKLAPIFGEHSESFNRSEYLGIKGFIQHYTPVTVTFYNFQYREYDWSINRSKTDEDVPNTDDLNVPDVTGIQNSCPGLIPGPNYKFVANCSRIINGKRDKKSTYLIDRATLCLFEKDTGEGNTEFYVLGKFEEEDKKDNTIETDIAVKKVISGIGHKDFNFKVKTKKIKTTITYNHLTQILTFKQRDRWYRFTLLKKRRDAEFACRSF